MNITTDSIPTEVPEEAITWLQSTTGMLAVAGTVLVFALATCRIFLRTGKHPALGLLMFVPVVNMVVFLMLAFGPWPMERELRGLRKVQKAARKVDTQKIPRAAA
jgi:hypothetical protein